MDNYKRLYEALDRKDKVIDESSIGQGPVKNAGESTSQGRPFSTGSEYKKGTKKCPTCSGDGFARGKEKGYVRKFSAGNPCKTCDGQGHIEDKGAKGDKLDAFVAAADTRDAAMPKKPPFGSAPPTLDQVKTAKKTLHQLKHGPDFVQDAEEAKKSKNWQCQECGAKFSTPKDKCPKCGGSDIDLAAVESKVEAEEVHVPRARCRRQAGKGALEG